MKNHEWTPMNTNMPRRRGRQLLKNLDVDYEILNAKTVTASGGSAVQMALRIENTTSCDCICFKL
jgi:hypothetical protein